MMKHLFHLITLVMIVYELQWVVDPKGNAGMMRRWHISKKENKDVSDWNDYPQEYKTLFFSVVPIQLIALAWLLIGLITFNWLLFAILLLFNLIIIHPLSELTKFGTAYTILHLINSGIGFVAASFILLNSYHFKINLWQFILDNI